MFADKSCTSDSVPKGFNGPVYIILYCESVSEDQSCMKLPVSLALLEQINSNRSVFEAFFISSNKELEENALESSSFFELKLEKPSVYIPQFVFILICLNPADAVFIKNG